MSQTGRVSEAQRWIAGLAAVAAVCCLGTVLVFAPGFLSPDSLDQLQQAEGSRPLTDWHPPVLSLVWRALIAALCGWRRSS